MTTDIVKPPESLLAHWLINATPETTSRAWNVFDSWSTAAPLDQEWLCSLGRGISAPLANEDQAAMRIDPNPPGVTQRPFTQAEADALDAPLGSHDHWEDSDGTFTEDDQGNWHRVDVPSTAMPRQTSPGLTSESLGVPRLSHYPPKLSRDQLWGICVGLVLTTNNDQRGFDIHSAMAAVAAMEAEGQTLNEMYAQLVSEVMR